MPTTNTLTQLQDFAAITRTQEPLAPFTALKIGGPAEAFIEPRTVSELASVVQRCVARHVPYRVLGAGGGLLVRDEGVRGVVLRLSAKEFTEVSVDGRRLRAGCGTPLSSAIAEAARYNLAGLESLVGLTGTIGGALRINAGDRTAEIGQFVRQCRVLDSLGQEQVRERDELHFEAGRSGIDEPVLVAADFELEPDAPATVRKRLLKAWIQHKANQPFSYQASARLFRNPPGLSAAALIEQAGLGGTRVGGAQVNDRNANYVVVDSGTQASDVLKLIELIQDRVQERFRTDLELVLSVW
jgi:UDP-N-acetylmuramate dehydrogenase